MNLPKHFTPYLAMLCALIALTLPTGHKITTDTGGLTPTTKPLSYSKPLEAPKLDEAVHLASIEVPKPVAPPVASAPVVAPKPTGGVVAGCGDNFYANYIYMHESGCNTGALNSIGCYGIGQACPASKIAHCGADYACQNEWFSSYAASSYGGWAGAYAHWLAFSWW